MVGVHTVTIFMCRFANPQKSLRSAVFSASICLLAAIAWSAKAQERVPFLPFDDAASVPSLAATRTAIVESLIRRDVRRIRPLLAGDFNGDEGGPENALKAFVQSPVIWDDLIVSLSGGGGFVDAAKRTFCAPFWHVRSPLDMELPASLWSEGLHPFIVVLPEVAAYESRTRKSKVVGHVGLELVRVIPYEGTIEGDEASGGLTAISLRGQTVYVDSSALLDPDARHPFACLERRDEKWLLTRFGYK